MGLGGKGRLGFLSVSVGVLVFLFRVGVFFKFPLILEDEPKKQLFVAFCHLTPPAVQKATRSRAGHSCCLKTSFL